MTCADADYQCSVLCLCLCHGIVAVGRCVVAQRMRLQALKVNSCKQQGMLLLSWVTIAISTARVQACMQACSLPTCWSAGMHSPCTCSEVNHMSYC